MTAAAVEPRAIGMRYRAFVARHEVLWELSFALLAIVFVLVGILPADDEPWVGPVEWGLTILFAAEFGSRLWAAESWAGYLRGHWIDIVALIPPTRGLRVLRLARLLRLIRAFAGFARALSAMGRLARHRGFIWLLFAWICVMLLTSLALYFAEVGVNKFVNTPFDALWWGIATMTTVGYGDIAPITTEGRIAAMVLMLLGIGLFSAVTAIITSFVLTLGGFSATGCPDPVATIRELGELRDAGYLADDAFAAKRDELLARL